MVYNFIKNSIRPTRAIFVVLGISWFLVILFLSLLTSQPGSPDEAANAFFIDRVSHGDSLGYDSKLTPAETNYWRPRSVFPDQGILKPGSFTGFVMASGWLDRLTVDNAYRLLTPLMAVVALVALFRILRRFWTPGWSWLGTGLVAIHPAWIQFQTLPDYHNGLFTSCLIVAGWRLMILWDDRRLSSAAWFGVAYGAALFIRPIEILWTAPLVAIVLLAQKNWRGLALAVLVTAVVQTPWLIVNQSLYGAWLSSGYAVGGAEDLLRASSETTSRTPRIFTPPGGWSWNWLHSTWHYLILLVPAWSAAAAVALAFYLRRIAGRPMKVFKIFLVTLPLFFVAMYYGSWDLYPLETPTTVGSLASYVRYWLPLYVPMAVGLLWLLQRIHPRWVAGLLCVGLLISQIVAVVWHPNSGLIARFTDRQRQVERRDRILAATPKTAAVIAGHMDKSIWPDRIVAFGWPDGAEDWAAVSTTVKTRPVYLLVTPRQYDRDRLTSDLQSAELAWGETVSLGPDELWEVVKP